MTETSASEPLLGPLHEQHLAAGAKMADFSGWSMPLSYPDGGVLAEHAGVRENVGLFDVSHLGKAQVTGPGAKDFVNSCLTNDLNKIEPGKAQYTMCCDDATGGVVDDLIAYVRSEEDVLLVPNAANTAEVVRRMQAVCPDGITITMQHTDYAVFAVQGPKSDEVLEKLGLPTKHGYMSFVDAEWEGKNVIICRTGYTGERGYELLPRWDDAVELWTALTDAVTSHDGCIAGLGARDTLRTEMGYPLHGNELSMEISPVQARAGWAVGWKKDAFWGKDVLTAEKAEGPARKLWGILATGKGVPRAGADVKNSNGDDIGITTSGTHSPTLREGIALALLDSATAEGDEVVMVIRGREIAGKVVKPPFVETSTS